MTRIQRRFVRRLNVWVDVNTSQLASGSSRAFNYSKMTSFNFPLHSELLLVHCADSGLDDGPRQEEARFIAHSAIYWSNVGTSMVHGLLLWPNKMVKSSAETKQRRKKPLVHQIYEGVESIERQPSSAKKNQCSQRNVLDIFHHHSFSPLTCRTFLYAMGGSSENSV